MPNSDDERATLLQHALYFALHQDDLAPGGSREGVLRQAAHAVVKDIQADLGQDSARDPDDLQQYILVSHYLAETQRQDADRRMSRVPEEVYLYLNRNRQAADQIQVQVHDNPIRVPRPDQEQRGGRHRADTRENFAVAAGIVSPDHATGHFLGDPEFRDDRAQSFAEKYRAAGFFGRLWMQLRSRFTPRDVPSGTEGYAERDWAAAGPLSLIFAPVEFTKAVWGAFSRSRVPTPPPGVEAPVRRSEPFAERIQRLNSSLLVEAREAGVLDRPPPGVAIGQPIIADGDQAQPAIRPGVPLPEVVSSEPLPGGPQPDSPGDRTLLSPSQRLNRTVSNMARAPESSKNWMTSELYDQEVRGKQL